MPLSTQAQVDAAEKVLKLSWVIVFGVILFSVFTVTPLVERSTPPGWEWSAPILPLVVDVAVVISIRVDAIVARLGGSTSGWPVALRVLTGSASVALNIGHSALKGDAVGVGVHMAAPVVLIVVAEASLKWRREIAAAADRIDRERADERERQRREQREREERSRAERDDARQAQAERERAARQAEADERRAAAEEREREREHAARIERETREHAAQLAAAERNTELEREAMRLKAAADERREKAAADERERQQRERDRKAKEAAQKAVQAARAPEPVRPALAPVSAAVSTPRPTVSATVSTPAHETAHDTTPAPKKLSESDARKAVADGVSAGRSQREISALTGWSTGWVAARVKDLEGAAA